MSYAQSHVYPLSLPLGNKYSKSATGQTIAFSSSGSATMISLTNVPAGVYAIKGVISFNATAAVGASTPMPAMQFQCICDDSTDVGAQNIIGYGSSVSGSQFSFASGETFSAAVNTHAFQEVSGAMNFNCKASSSTTNITSLQISAYDFELVKIA